MLLQSLPGLKELLSNTLEVKDNSAAISIQDTEAPKAVEGYYHDVEAAYRDLVDA